MGSETKQGNAPINDIKHEFEMLYRESYPTVYNFVRARSGENLVETIVAEAYLKAARSFGSYDPATMEFSAWVIAIAKRSLDGHLNNGHPAEPRICA